MESEAPGPLTRPLPDLRQMSRLVSLPRLQRRTWNMGKVCGMERRTSFGDLGAQVLWGGVKK